MTEQQHPARHANRYWNDRPLPTAKADFFNAVTTPAPAAEGGSIATIRMYGPIDSWGGFWGISTRDMGQVLDALPDSVDRIILRINSPGGEVFEASAILNMLRAHKARVTAVVDGLAASAASVIAAGADETVMSPGTQMMIHKPSTIVWGNSADMRKEADVLDSIESSLVEIYTGKAGERDWAALLADETWMSAADAVTTGLADRVAVIPDAGESSTVGEDDDEVLLLPDEEVDDIAAAIAVRISARLREHAPAGSIITHGAITSQSIDEGAITVTSIGSVPSPGDIARATKNSRTVLDTARVSRPAEPGTTNTDTKGDDNMPSYSPEVRNALGLPAEGDIDDATFTAAVAAAARPATASIPEGTTLISDETLATLQANAQAGAEARAQQTTERRVALVEAAIEDGRIAPARRDHWLAALDADEEGAAATLASLATGLVPVAAKATSGGPDASSDEDRLYSKIASNLGVENTKEA